MGLALGVGGAVLALIVAAGIVVDRRDHRASRRQRDAGDIWRTDVREHRRDVRAAGQTNFMDQDRTWTRDHQRGREK
jgi:hypothetical protein